MSMMDSKTIGVRWHSDDSIREMIYATREIEKMDVRGMD
jgi:hypothetical protein